MNVNILDWMQEWLISNCNGDWEHSQNFTITTIDNPGWSIKINLNETFLENSHLENIRIERTETDWIHCYLKNQQFFGYCGEKNLIETLKIFINWAENQKNFPK